MEKINTFPAPPNNTEVLEMISASVINIFTVKRHEIISSLENYLRVSAQLNSFKDIHSINQPAKYPSDLLFHFSIVLLFIVIETALNAFFYRGEAGLLGGAFLALCVSIVNMGLAVGCGYAFRYHNLSDLKSKIIGYVSLGTFVIMGIILNLIFATFRIAYIEAYSKTDIYLKPDLIDAFLEAVKQAFGVFLLKFPRIDFESFILFFLGIFFSIIAFYKGYTANDKYPGHGDRDKTFKKHENEYFRIIELTYNEAKDLLDRRKQDINELISKCNSIHTRSIELRTRLNNLYNNYIMYITNLQDDANLVLNAYRNSNMGIRTTPAPAYFQTHRIEINPIEGPQEQLNLVESVIEKARNLNDNNLKPLRDIVLNIDQHSYKYLSEYYEKFLKEIKVEATNIINKNIPNVIRGQ